jgi:hypothetical protein
MRTLFFWPCRIRVSHPDFVDSFETNNTQQRPGRLVHKLVNEESSSVSPPTLPVLPEPMVLRSVHKLKNPEKRKGATATAPQKRKKKSSSSSSKEGHNDDSSDQMMKKKKKPRHEETTTMTKAKTTTKGGGRRKKDPFTTVEVDVKLPDYIVNDPEFWTQTIVRNYRHTASYWPVASNNDGPPAATALASIETCFAAHQYYMDGLTFSSNSDDEPYLYILTESAAVTPRVGHVACQDGDENMPFDYLNLVHCLPYGESWLLSGGNLEYLTKTERQGMNNGTKPFWKLLAVLAGRLDVQWNEDGTFVDPLDRPHDCFDFLLAKAQPVDRLHDKKDILSRLKERRIVLVDTSLFPIFQGGSKTHHTNKETGTPYYTNSNYLKANNLINLHLHTCWTYYAKVMMEQHRPRNVLVLSKTLERVIGKADLVNTVQAYGGRYHNARVHPSTTLSNENRAVELKAIREIVRQSMPRRSTRHRRTK